MRFRFLTLCLAVLLVIALVGCSSDQERATSGSAPEPVSVSAVQDELPPAISVDNNSTTGSKGSSTTMSACPPAEPCRVTGGGVDQNGNWDGSLAEGKDDSRDRYQFGGQAGAPTALQPQPSGEWTHHQQRGPSGSFTFHAGTASAPYGTMISYIACVDPGYCNPARPAPAKQIDFQGVGTFKNMKGCPPLIAENVVVGESRHFFIVNIDDAGEPGKSGKMDVSFCPDQGFGYYGGAELVDCDCPDFYRITIFADESPDTIIYQVYGYIKGGNLQIHPPTGYDL